MGIALPLCILLLSMWRKTLSFLLEHIPQLEQAQFNFDDIDDYTSILLYYIP